MPPRRTFGRTWWATLKHRVSVDPNRLLRGHTYTRKGPVSEPGFDAGEVTARARGSRTG